MGGQAQLAAWIEERSRDFAAAARRRNLGPRS
jgi:hypothetical protein